MRTLREMRESGRLREYMEDVGHATQSIMASVDGSDTNTCDFVIMVTDGRTCEYISTVGTDEIVKLITETKNKIRGGGGKLHPPALIRPKPETVYNRVCKILAELGPVQHAAVIDILNHHKAAILEGEPS